MTEEQISKLIQTNERLNLLLGYALGFVTAYGNSTIGLEREKYDWLIKAVENLIYLDKPLPPCP